LVARVNGYRAFSPVLFFGKKTVVFVSSFIDWRKWSENLHGYQKLKLDIPYKEYINVQRNKKAEDSDSKKNKDLSVSSSHR